MARNDGRIKIPFLIEGLKRAKKDFDGLEQSVKDLTDTSDRARKRIDDLPEELRGGAIRAEKAMRRLGVTSERSTANAIRGQEKLKQELREFRRQGLISARDYEAAMKRANENIARASRNASEQTERAWRESLRKIQARVQALSARIRGALAPAGLVGVAGLASPALLGGAAARQISQAADYADALRKLSRQTNVATEELSGLAFAFEQSGLSTQTLFRASNNLNRALTDQNKSEIFDRLGLSVRDASGNFRSFEQLIPEVAGALNRIQDPVQRAALAAEIFGRRAGPEMATFISLGEKGIRDYISSAREFGIVVTDEAGEAAERFNDRLDDLQRRLLGIRLQASAPLFDAFAQSFVALGQVIDRNRQKLIDFAGVVAGEVLKATRDLIRILDGDRSGLETSWVAPLIDTAISLGRALRDVLLPALQAVSGVLNLLGPNGARVVAIMLLFGSVLGPLVSTGFALYGAFVLLGPAIKGFGAAILAAIGTIGAVPLAIAAAVAAGGLLLIRYWDEVRNAAGDAWRWIRENAVDSLAFIGRSIVNFMLLPLRNAARLFNFVSRAAGGGRQVPVVGFSSNAAFADGGYTGDGPRLEPAGTVHRGEYVFSADSVRRWGVGALEMLHQGVVPPSMMTPMAAPVPVGGGGSGGRPLTLNFPGGGSAQANIDRENERSLRRAYRREMMRSPDRAPGFVR